MPPLNRWDDKDIDRYRQYLRTRAELLQRDPRVRLRVDPSDLVQETLARAVASPHPCQGSSDGERLAWLAAIQNAVAIDKWREHTADKRDVAREQQLRDAIEGSTAHWEANLAGREDRPSVVAARNEMCDRLMSAAQDLEPQQREAVLAVLLLNESLQDVADRLGVTKAKVAGWYRTGLGRLRQVLKTFEEGWP